MRKFILNTFLFLLFTAVFYTLTILLWGRYAPSIFKPNIGYKIGGAPGHMYSRVSEVKNHNDLDILFLGSSHSYRGFDPRIFSKNGYKTFNLGSSGQTPIQTKVLIERYLEALNPTKVIYEVYPASFTRDGVESSLDIIANDKNDLHSLKMALKTNNIKTYNTFLFGVSHDLLNLNKSFTESPKKGKDRYISGGYVEKELSYFKPTPLNNQEITLNQEQLTTFSEILKVLKNKNIEIVLVYAPIPKVRYNSYSNNSYYDSLMTSYATYYNFNQFMTLNDSLHFYDDNHLNQSGVELFNERLIRVLKEK